MNRQLFSRVRMLLLVAILAIPLSAQDVTVNVTQEGGLWDALEAQGYTDFTTIKNLTVTGTMGNIDFQLIKNQMSNLESIDIAGIDVKEIPSGTFADKGQLKTARLPEGITNISNNLFNNCQLLESVTFGSQTAVTGKIVFPASLRYVESSAFSNCQALTNLDFAACTNLERIGSSAFSSCKGLTYLDFSACTSLRNIENYALSNLDNLKEVILPSQGNLSLGYNCFRVDNSYWDETTQQWIYKGLETLTLTKAVTYLSNYSMPSTLKTLFVESSMPASCEGSAFDYIATSLIVYVPNGSKRNYAVADGWSKLYQKMQELGFKVNITGYGMVQKGNSSYGNGDVFFPTLGSATTLTAVPDMGNQLISVKLNNNDVNVTDGTFTIPAETTIGTLDVAFTTNPFTIDNPNGGELQTLIAASGRNANTISVLKVTGTMTAKDWTFVKNNLPALEVFDISETDLTAIPEDALRDKNKLTTVHLPTSVTTIGNTAFYGCNNLAIVDGCNNVTEIGSNAFGYCYKLSVFPFGDAIQRIQYRAFEYCNSLPTTLVFSATLTSLSSNVFRGSSVRSFDLSQCTFTNGISDNTFGECTSLLLPEKGSYNLDWNAFDNSKLTELRLPAAVSGLSGNVFPNTLERLYVSRTEPLYISSNSAFNGIDFNSCTLYVPIGSTEAYQDATGWSSFTKVIETGFKVNITGYGKVQQGSITYGNGDVFFASQGSAITLKAIPEVGNELISVKLSGNALSVTDGSFTIPAETTIGTLDVAFTANQPVIDNANGGELSDKILAMGLDPNTLVALKVTGKMSTKDWSFVKSNLPMMEEFDLSGTDLKNIPNEALRDRYKLTTVHLPASVTSIGNSAFSNCPNLAIIDGCEKVTDIGSSAFNNCQKLSVFPFGDALQRIGSNAFSSCNSLPTALVMPASLTYISDNAFGGSSIRSFDLSQCTFTNGISYSPFGECTSLLLPEKGNYNLSWYALGSTKLTELRLPMAVSYIYGQNVLPETLKSLYVSSTTPIDGDYDSNNPFNKIDFDNCTLYVPVGSAELYKEAKGWSEFTNVKECGFKVKTDGHGSIKYDEKTYQGGMIFPPVGVDITMQAVPDVGYEIASLTLNDMVIEIAADGTFVIPSTFTGGTIEAKFTNKQLQIAITMEGSGSYTIDDQTYTAATTLSLKGGSKVKMLLQPASGSFVKQVTINGEDAILKNGGLEVTTAALDANTNIAIIFSSDATSVATVTFKQEGFGKVSYGDVTFEDSNTLTLVKGKSITLNFVPTGDANLQSLLINDADVTANVSDNAYTLSNVTANTTVKTTFFSSNMITVNNPNGGELKDLIAAMGSNARTITALKVVGKMSNKDWNYVKNSLPMLAVFDISETEVKVIPEQIFENNQTLTTVHLSPTVVTISNNAFWDCQQLTTVDGCEHVREIGSSAFGSCRKLTNFPFGNEIRSIGSSAFSDCSSLPETLVMPASLSSLGWSNVFSGSSIQRFDLSQCTLTGGMAYNEFGKCTSLLLPEKGDYYFDTNALREAELTDLRLPSALSRIYGDNVLPTTLERLYVSHSTPIEVSGNKAFNNLDLDRCTLYVPIGSTKAYSEASGWVAFTNVKEYGMQVTVAEEGKVRAGGQTLMGNSIFFPSGDAVTFEIIPNEGWHADAVTLDGTNIPFADNKFTLGSDQLSGKLAVTFAVNQFTLQLQIAGSGKVKLGTLEYTANQALTVDNFSTLNFTLEPAEGQVVSSITFNGEESVVQNGGKNYVTPAITANSTLAITFGAAGDLGDIAVYTVTTGEGGSVEYKNTTLLPETTVNLPKGQDAVFAMKPEQYYMVDVVKLNGENVTSQLDADGKLTVKNVTDAAKLEVTFRINAEIAVEMENGGTLTNMLSEKQKAMVTKLTIKGQLWDRDFRAMRDEMPLLTEIDLWEAKTEYIPNQAFCTSANWSGNSVGIKTLTKVRLPKDTRTISDFAFAGCSNLQEVNFTELNNLEYIYSNAFESTSLQVIDLSNTKLTEIGSAFRNVKNLENIKFPQTLTSLNDAFCNSTLTEIDLSGCTNLKSLSNTFTECKSLVKVILPEGLTTIGSSTFNSCEALTTINFPKSLQIIGGSAFSNTKLERADLSELTELQSIGNSAFSNCQELADVLFPSSFEKLENYAFHNCQKLTSVDLSKTQLKNIPTEAFSYCGSLESVKMPKTLETIGRYAFAWNYKLGGVLELASTVTSIGESAFAGTQISVVRSEATVPPTLSNNSLPDAWVAAFVPEGYAETYRATAVWEDKVILDKEVHADVTVSKEGNLAIDINEQAGVAPALVTHLKVHGPLGAQDFTIMRENMTVLYDLDMSDAKVSVIPENAFNNVKKKVMMNVILPASLLRIEKNAFYGCSGLNGSLVLPEGVKFIGMSAFQGCTSLDEVVLNENLQVIQAYAFEGCSSLTQEITLPRNFESLGRRAFANCSSLYGTVKFNRDFYMFMGTEGYGSSAGECFTNCSKIETVDMSDPDFLDEIPYGTFSGCTSLKTVLLPPMLDRIDNYAFSGCTSLDNIAFPNKLKVINYGAFQDCRSLSSVNLSDCKILGTIEGYAFYGCSNLETVYLPKSLNWINDYAFADCRKLANLTVEALQPADLGSYVFRHVHTDRCVLSIPTGTFYDYLSAAQWGEFVSMRKNIDVTVGEGANLYFMNGDSEAANSPRRAGAAGQQGSMVKDGSSLYVQENEKAIFTVSPEENVVIAKVLFNGQDVTDQMMNGTYQTPGVTDASSFEVQVNVVGDIHVKELRMLDADVAVKVGENRQLRYAVYPSNATNKNIAWTSSDESVAQVNSEGIVTGMAPGRVEITGKTVDGDFEEKCEIVVMSNNYWIVMDNTVENYVENEIRLPLALHNEGEARDIQFDIYMPEGVNMKDWYGNFDIQLSARSNGHQVAAARTSDGAVRVIVYSQNGNQFQDSDGELLTLPFTTGTEVGDFDVTIKNIHVSGPDNFDFAAPNHTIRFTLNDYPLGDSNGDGSVTTNDIVYTVDHILERYLDRFMQRSADVNKDNQITVADVTGTVDIVLERPSNRAASNNNYDAQGRLYMSDQRMIVGEQQTIGLQIENAAEFIAFQCDVYLPAGMTIARNENDGLMIGLSGDVNSNHIISANLLENGVVRMVVMSPQNEAIDLANNNIVNLTVMTDDAMIDGSVIDIRDIRLVRGNNSEYLAPDASASVYFGDPTGISNTLAYKELKIRVEGHDIIVGAPSDTVLRLTSVNGISKNLQVHAGENRFHVETSGVYVINGKKFVIK